MPNPIVINFFLNLIIHLYFYSQIMPMSPCPHSPDMASYLGFFTSFLFPYPHGGRYIIVVQHMLNQRMTESIY